jgi:sugar lactone lactonase YvrE
MNADSAVEQLFSGIGFLEGLRWRSGKLWASSVNDKLVVALDENGVWEECVHLGDDYPAGLGWAPQGDLIVVAMQTQQLRRYRAGTCVQTTPLAPFARFACNDLLVTPDGDAFVSHFGYDFRAVPRRPELAPLIHVGRDGAARRTGIDLHFPNGIGLSPDGRTLVVAETDAHRLTAFDHDGRGGLSNPRVMVDLGPAQPDGLAMDARGGVWICCLEHGVIHVDSSGEITTHVRLQAPAYACALGGPTGHDLFCSTFLRDPSKPPESVRTGALVRIRASVPAA